MTNHPNDLKKEFQVERIAFFSDAVFAIAITLLIIEVKVPEVHDDGHSVAHKLGELIPKFIGFIVSFFVIGMYWVNHHRFFKHIIHYNQKLIWGNMLLLFSIVLMPFSSAFYSEYWFSDSLISIGFYVFNITLTGIFNTRMWYIISNPANKLSSGLEDRNLVRYLITRSMVPSFIFTLSFIVALFSRPVAYWCPVLIFVVLMFIRMYYKKHHPEIFAKL
ncbi:TMEM175 family protein [Mucilaginibacter limnophilus]|nr:TMEM175 family protein [Mucilaginibacter limnophilus]